jgi:predicted Zn-dependent protease
LHIIHGVNTPTLPAAIARLGLLATSLVLSLPCTAQQGATEVDQIQPPRAAPNRPLRITPRRDISAELSAAQARVEAQDWLAAAAELSQARDKDPGNLELLYLLGFYQRRGRDLDGALSTFSALLKLAPQHLTGHEQIGKTYLMLQRPEEAQQHLRLLQKLCGDCKESRELDRAITVFLR